jgi:hypothetical protein
MEAFTGPLKTVYLGFFASHILFTILLDGQALLPSSWYPKSVRDFSHWYATTFHDPLMSRPKELLWFQSLIATELLFQLPFFVVACTTLWTTPPSNNTKASYYSDAFRCACIAYGASTATTLVPILATVLFEPGLTASQRAVLTSIYLPYLLLPAGLAWRATTRPILSVKTD